MTKDGVVLKNIAHLVDKNGDGEVDFEEFVGKIVEWMAQGFNILDKNNDGSVDELLSPNSLDQFRFELFEKLLSIYTEMLDNDMDDAITASDTKLIMCNSLMNNLPYLDCRGEEKWNGSFSELFQDPNFFQNFPTPVKKIYNALDEDLNQEFTMKEIQILLKRILTSIDKNGNCQISLKEVLVLLKENNLAEDSLLAVKMLGENFLTLAKYLADGFIRSADNNEDSKVTLQEVLKFSDFNFIKTSSSVIHGLGSSLSGPAQYITKGNNFHSNIYDSYQAWREAEEKNLANWLAVLDSFVDNLPSSPTAQCTARQYRLIYI